MKVIKNILKNMVMIGAFIIIVTTPVFADVAVPAMNPVEGIVDFVFNSSENPFVMMVFLAVVIALVCTVLILWQGNKKDSDEENK